MYVLALMGSPHDMGNTATLTQDALDAAAARGAETKMVRLNELTIRGCQGCYGCQRETPCVQQDDMTTLYEEINRADAVLIASPVYMGYPFTAQTKLFIDRLFPYIQVLSDRKSRMKPGKRLGLIITQNQPASDFYRAKVEELETMLHFLGFGEGRAMLGADLGGPTDAAARQDYREEARHLGEFLAGI
ncbi:MAG TPA: flavodoxin family protein [Synergistaceae bacterium]|nr:flavodoxin family protein [Synergistaceae bacterium]